MGAEVGLPEALERAATALPELADVIRPANGDPFALRQGLDASGVERVLGWLLAQESDAGVELAVTWATDDAEGLPALAALQQASLPKPARKALRKVLHHLRSAGVEVPEAPRRETVSKLPPVADGIDEAMVTPLDPTGARLVYLALPHPGGGARLFMVALDDERGVLQFEIYNAPRRDARRFLRDFQQRRSFAGVPVPSDAVRVLIARALAAHPADKPLPKGFTEWRSRLAETPESAVSPGALARAALEGAGADAEAALQRAVQLVEAGEVGPWMPRAEVLEATVEQLRGLEDSTLIVSGATRREQAEEILDASLAELYAEPSATRAAWRFEEAAFLLWKGDREEDARACLAAADRFQAGGGDNPVARATVRRLLGPLLDSLDQPPGEREQTDESPLIVQP